MPEEKLIAEKTSTKIDDWFSDLYDYLVQFLKTIVYFSWFPVRYAISKDKKSFFLNNSSNSVSHAFYIFVSLFIFSWFVNLAIFRKVNNLSSETIDFSYKYFVNIDITGKIFLTIPIVLVFGLIIEVFSRGINLLSKQMVFPKKLRESMYFFLSTALLLFLSTEFLLMLLPDFKWKNNLGLWLLMIYSGSLALVLFWHWLYNLSFLNFPFQFKWMNSGKSGIKLAGWFFRKALIGISLLLIAFPIFTFFVYAPTISKKLFEAFFRNIDELKVKPEVDFQGLEKKDTLIFDLRNLMSKKVISSDILCINQSSSSVLLNNCDLFQVYLSENTAEKVFLNFQNQDCVNGPDSTHLELESGRLLRQNVISKIDSLYITDILKKLEKVKRVFISIQYLPKPDFSPRLPINLIIRQ